MNFSFRTLLTLAGILIAASSNAQTSEIAEAPNRHLYPHIVSGVLFESTIIGAFGTGFAGVSISKRFDVGAFYENIITSDKNIFSENLATWGGYVDFNIFQERKLGVSLFLRGGLQENGFAFLSPSLLTEWTFNKWFQLNVLAGFRKDFPSVGLMGKFSIPLKKEKK
jgi:hypothetical protein